MIHRVRMMVLWREVESNPLNIVFKMAIGSSIFCMAGQVVALGQQAPSNVVITIVVEPSNTQLPTSSNPSSMTSPDVASARWTDIKDYPYSMRGSFFANLQKFEAKLDQQINELNARRVAMKSGPNTTAWDFAIKEMTDARFELQSAGVELSRATAQTWNQHKQMVGQAWVRTQEAYRKVKTTNNG